VALVAAGAKGKLTPVIARARHALAPVLQRISPVPSASGGSPVSPASSPSTSASAAPSFVQHKQAAPLSSAQLGAPLVKGEFVTACNAPPNMKVVVKITVQKGHTIATNVATDPPDTTVSRCIDDALSRIRWDITPNAQQLTVRY
jgi:hypothetical protein